MRKRGRPTHKGMGRSDIVPYRHGEHWRDRHERRLMTNLNRREYVDEFCQIFDVTLKVKNRGHHWIFERYDFGRDRTLLAEWWPSSARMVFDKNWNDAIHVHDHDQATQLLVDRWRLVPLPQVPDVEEFGVGVFDDEETDDAPTK